MSLKKWFAASALMVGMTAFPAAFANANDNDTGSDKDKSATTAVRADVKSSASSVAVNIPVKDYVKLSGSQDEGERMRATSTLTTALYRLINLHQTKPLRQPKAGETQADIMRQQAEIANWMLGHFGTMMDPDLGTYRLLVHHLHEKSNPNQSLYSGIMGYVVDTIRYQQSLSAQKTQKQSTPQP